MNRGGILQDAIECHDTYNYMTCDKAGKTIKKHRKHLKNDEMTLSEQLIKLIKKASSMYHTSETYKLKGNIKRWCSL